MYIEEYTIEIGDICMFRIPDSEFNEIMQVQVLEKRHKGKVTKYLVAPTFMTDAFMVEATRGSLTKVLL